MSDSVGSGRVDHGLEAAVLHPVDEHPTVALETLTDEELAVLSEHDTVVVTPYLSEIAPRERTALMRTAYRGLVARGILDPPTEQARAEAERRVDEARRAAREAGEPSPPADELTLVELQVRNDVKTTVALRQGAEAVVAMARTTALTQDYVYVHVVDDVLLIEEVGSDGMHRFALRPRADLEKTVVHVAVHPDAGDSSGPEIEMRPLDPADPSPPDEVLEAAGAALVRCDLTVLRTDEPQPTMLGLFSAPAGCWLFSSRLAEGRVTVEPVAAHRMREAVREQLAPILEKTA